MKKKTIILFVFVSCLFLTACNNEDNVPFTPQEGQSIYNSSSINYNSFIAKLKNEFPDKTVYSDHNRPDFSKEIESLISKLDQSEDIGKKTLKNLGTINGATFGPYGDTENYGGASFDARLSVYPEEKWKKLKAIKVRSGWWINAIQLYWINNNNVTSRSPHFGGNGGSENWLYLADNEYITGIRLTYGWYIDNITFITNYNVYTFGGSGNANPTNLNFGISGYQMHGIFGTEGGKEGFFINKLGFYCYPNSLFP